MDLVLLGVMVHYTSWLFMLGFVFISWLIGGWLLNDGLRLYMRNNERLINANQMSAEVFLLGAVARLAAGLLFMVPGVLTDLMAVILLSPAKKWLARILFASLLSKKFPNLASQSFDFRTPGKKPAKDEIIDVHVSSPHEEEHGNDR